MFNTCPVKQAAVMGSSASLLWPPDRAARDVMNPRNQPIISRTALVLGAEVDYVDAVAGVAVGVVGEYHRGGGAGFVDDLRDL
jgi:hypothetical protein